MKKEWGIFLGLLTIFLIAYLLNFTDPKIQAAIMEAFYMLQWYARNHTLACVVPAMFIAGAIATFFSKEAVLRHLGPKANKVEAYGVASVSGTVLAVCSCSVLPMFAGIYRVGAGLGPAAAFLYSGPAINVMAIFLTARVLGFDLGIARIIGSVVFAIIIGLIMAAIFHKDEQEREVALMQLPDPPPSKRSLWQTAVFLGAMIAFLVFADWANPSMTTVEKTDGTKMQVAVLLETTDMFRVQLEQPVGELKKGVKLIIPKSEIVSRAPATPEGYEWASWVYVNRWYFSFAFLAATLLMVWGWFDRAEINDWLDQTWGFAKSIIPLLFGGVFVTGFVGALIPESWVASWVGGDSFTANLVASLIGAMWYFATLTEIPILEALIGLGMGRGPALALLLAGPALSLPSIAVIYSVIGFKKTVVFVFLTVIMSTCVGIVFGWFFV
ncbi:MAG: permease [Pirellulaceae bacterium]